MASALVIDDLDGDVDDEIEVVHRRKDPNADRGKGRVRGRGRGVNGAGRATGFAAQSTKPVNSLTLASFQGKLPDVRRLLQQRADVNALEGKRVRTSPLMAASASGSVAAVAALLVAGADPSIKSREGMYAADLLSKTNNGHAIGRLLKTFSTELEIELNKATSSDKGPDELHAEAMEVIQKNAITLVEKALKKRKDKGNDVVAMDETFSGDAARQARKKRKEKREALKLQKEREKIRKEKARLKAVADKAARRRGKEEETEVARLKRVARAAAARRRRKAIRLMLQSRQALKEEKKKRKKEERGDSRSSSRSRNADGRRKKKQRPSRSRERAAEHGPTVMCPACGQTGETLKCGLCGAFGVCGMCSVCYLCQRASGWCAAPTVATLPGMAGASGKPEMCGMSHPSEAFPHLYERPGKKKKKDDAISLDDSDDESGAEEDAGEEEAEEEEPVTSSEEEDPGPEPEDSSSSSSSSDEEEEGSVKEEDGVKKEEDDSDEDKVKEEIE